MKEIPLQLLCAYCERSSRHGGECHRPQHEFLKSRCLAFKQDPYGCIREDERIIEFPLYYDIPQLDAWDDGWAMNGEDTKIKITSIRGLSWDARKGLLRVRCRYQYYINEYRDDYKEPDKKPALRVLRRSGK